MSERKRFSILEYRNGIFQGDINQNTMRDGLGVYLWDSGEFYYGEWSLDFMQGEGILYFPYGGFIRGSFIKNRIYGLGILQFPNGDMYKGEWKEGKLNGQCYKYFIQNDTWMICEYKDGVFQNCKAKGKGQSDSHNYVETKLLKLEELERKYNIERNYFGYSYKCVTFPDNGKFIGVIKNDLPNGLGIFHYTDGKIDEGFYRDGMLDGFGRLNFQNGDIYDGMMKNGLFDGFGIFYKGSLNKWVYGVYENNKCKRILENGQNKPNEALELLKKDQHKTSSYFQDKLTKCNVFEIPKFSESNCQKNQDTSLKQNKSEKNIINNNTKHTKNKKFVSSTPDQKMRKAMKTKEISINTETIEVKSQSIQTNSSKMLVDSWTQTPTDNSETNIKNPSEENKDKTEIHGKNEETQKTIISSSMTSDIESNEKKRLTKFEIESLFQSVKNMIIGVKEKDVPKAPTTTQAPRKLDIQNLKESTDFLIQKLENIKKSKDEVNMKQSSLQSSDFMLSRSESMFSNIDFNNHLNQKASNMIESKLLDSCFSNNGNANLNQNNEINITKSIDFIEKMLSSQVFANGLSTKESKLSNNIALSNIDHLGEHNFYSDADIDMELFQSNVMSSYKNGAEDINSLNNMILLGNQRQIENNQMNKDKIMIYDQESSGKQNQELMAKYGSGIEKIEEKAEEINYSPNSKNTLLKFNSENLKKHKNDEKTNSENILRGKRSENLNVLELNLNHINITEGKKVTDFSNETQKFSEKENRNIFLPKYYNSSDQVEKQ